MKTWLCALLAGAMLFSAAAAEDTITADINAAGRVEGEGSYLRVTGTVSGEAVSMSVSGPDGLIYSRAYGEVTGEFTSDEVYLPLRGDPTDYSVKMTVGAEERAFTVRRRMPALTAVTACSAGTAAVSGVCITLVEPAGGDGKTVMPMVAEGREIGRVAFKVRGDTLTVKAELNSGIRGSVNSGTVYVALNRREAEMLGYADFDGLTDRLGKAIPLSGNSPIAVYVQLDVSAEITSAPAAETEQPGQAELYALLP